MRDIDTTYMYKKILTSNLLLYLKFNSEHICCDVHIEYDYEPLLVTRNLTRQERKTLTDYFLGRTLRSIDEEFHRINQMRNAASSVHNLSFQKLMEYTLDRILENATTKKWVHVPEINTDSLLSLLEGE